MIVTISGRPGSGKSTVGQMLATRLSCEYYDIGRIRRDMAVKRGMTIAEYNKLGETDASTDHEVDEYQRGLSKKDGLVLVSRLGFHFVPNSVKVFLDVDIEEAARRIMADESRGPDERVRSADVAKRLIDERNTSDLTRYKKYYGINPYDLSHYDIIIDTSDKSPKQIVEMLLQNLSE